MNRAGYRIDCRSILLPLILLCASLLSACSTHHSNIDLLLRNVTVIDATKGERAGQDVAVSNGKIVSVSSSVAVASAEKIALREIDASDKFLIPGLWDAHVHLTFDEDVAGSMNRLFIANGITSVRDTGGQLAKVLAFRRAADKQLAPSIYLAGPLLDGKPTVYDGSSGSFPKIAATIETPRQAREKVRELAAAGVDLLKAYEMLAPEVYLAVLDEAKELGLPVTGHVPLSMTVSDVSSAGLNSMEHLRNLELGCTSGAQKMLRDRLDMLLNEAGLSGAKLRGEIHALQHGAAIADIDSQRCAALIQELKNNETWQVPTMALNLLFQEPFYADPAWQENYQYLPAAVAKDWQERSIAVAERLLKPSDRQAERNAIADWRSETIKALVAAEVPIMAGTDTPIFFLTPGFSLHLELKTLVAKGLTPMQAIEAATLTPARYFGLQENHGGIDSDYVADLVLLDANPLQDISNTTAIAAVVKNGEWLDRGALDKLLKPEE